MSARVENRYKMGMRLAIAATSVALALTMTGCGQMMVEKGLTNGNSPTSSQSDGAVCYEEYCESDSDYYYGCVVPYEFNTEEYAAIKEHGFISVATNPFSTFSADVDTASYCNLRRMIREGYGLDDIPDGAVRVEEMLNYFDYDYADPQGNQLFGVTSCISDCPWNKDTKLLVLGLQTNTDPKFQSQGNNLVFLIDTSGSMDSPDKLELLQDSFSYLLDQLDDEDVISIVTYSGEERVVLEGVKAKEQGRILRAINRLRAEGSTNGQAGLARAYELAQRNFIEGGNNRIILASDGDLNVGITDESELEDYVSEMRESGVYLSVLGFGAGNYKDTKMETIADNGNGAYYYIDCMEEAERVFGQDLTATLYTLAEDVKLQLEFNPAYVKGYRQIGYENRALETDDFKDDSVDAGEVGAGHSVTVAYELVMADSPLQLSTTESRYSQQSTGVENGEWLTLAVRYKNPDSLKVLEQEQAIGAESYHSSPTDDWTFAAGVIQFAMLASDSEYGNGLDKTDLRAWLRNLDKSDSYREEFVDLVQQVLDAPGFGYGYGYEEVWD